MIPDLSPTSKFGTIIPLTVIALLTAAKELSEDAKRHAQDRQVNSRKSKILIGNSNLRISYATQVTQIELICKRNTIRIKLVLRLNCNTLTYSKQHREGHLLPGAHYN